MSDMKERMIEAYERGECSYEGSYDYVRESMADAADRQRKTAKETGRIPTGGFYPDGTRAFADECYDSFGKFDPAGAHVRRTADGC